MNYMAANITVAVSTRHPTIINCCIYLAASICMTSFSTSTCYYNMSREEYAIINTCQKESLYEGTHSMDME